MRQMLIVVVIAQLALLLTLPATAETGVAQRSIAVDTPSDHSRDGRDYLVLWDMSHGPYAEYTLSGWYSDLNDALINAAIVSYETIYSLQYVYLESYDVIVIGTTLAWDSAYTAAELAAIQDFIDAGGSLLVMADNSDTPNENINPITEAYGITCQTTGSEPNHDTIDFGSYPIFAGVSQLSLGGPGSLLASAPAETLATASSGEALVGLSGDGAVIVIGDCNFCENDYLGLADNETFILNVFDYLGDPEAGAPEAGATSWGRVKASYK